MLKSYIKTAWRSLWKNKTFSLINVTGLAVGIACCLLISLYIYHELSYDNFHQKGDRIVRVTMEAAYDGEGYSTFVTGTAVSPVLQREFPEVDSGVRIYDPSIFQPTLVSNRDQVYEEEGFYYADSNFFQIFSFPLLQGNPSSVLELPNSVVLTSSYATKYFNNQDPIGKVLLVDNSKEYQITGVMADVPENSQIQFDFVASFSSLSAAKTEYFHTANYVTYLLLKDKTDINRVEAKIPALLERMLGEPMTESNYTALHLEPFYDVHLRSDVKEGLSQGNDITAVAMLGLVGLIILLIAIINYVNLTTSRSSERAKEVGVRKVMGTSRGQLFWQFIGESLIITFISFLVGLVLAGLLLPLANQLSGKVLSFSLFLEPLTLSCTVLAVLFIGLLAGAYPAVMLTNFKPSRILKGSFAFSSSGMQLRKGLIILQFALSTGFIIATLVVQSQLKYIQNKSLGYNKGQVMVLPTDREILNNFESFKTQLKQHQQIHEMTLSTETPARIEGSYGLEISNDQWISMSAVGVEKDFVQTLGMEIIEGSDFSDSDVSQLQTEYDSLRYYHFLVNEAAVKKLNWDLDQVVGKKMHLSGRHGEVKGVVKDFHFTTMHSSIKPLVLFLNPDYQSKLMVKIGTDEISTTLASMEESWKQFFPHRPFEYEFLDQEFLQLYQTEYRMAEIFRMVSGLAIILASFGLLGLVIFNTRQRVKEIGIRKVLGASLVNIVTLLYKDYFKLIFLATLIAIPLASYLVNKWLINFEYRIEIGWEVFVLAALITTGIAVFTIAQQSIRASLANPVNSLRDE